jgi:TRAP-type C4-dicarboxylate transport system permease small subunit
MAQISRLLSLASLYVSVLGLVMMTAIIGWQVFARYMLNTSPDWSEQAALYLMLWFILFAAAAGVREGFHIRLSLLQDRLSEAKSRALRTVCHALVGVFGAALAWSGAELVVMTWSHTIPTLGLPRGSGYIPLSVSGLLILFFSVEHIQAELSGGEVRSLWN